MIILVWLAIALIVAIAGCLVTGAAVKFIALLTIWLGVVLILLSFAFGSRQKSDDVPLAIYSGLVGLALIAIGLFTILALIFRAI